MKTNKKMIAFLLLFTIVGIELASATTSTEIPVSVANTIKPKIIESINLGVSKGPVEKCSVSHILTDPTVFSSFESVSYEEKSGFGIVKFDGTVDYILVVSVLTSEDSVGGDIISLDPSIRMQYIMTYETGSWIFKRTVTEAARYQYNINLQTTNDVKNDSIKFQFLESDYTITKTGSSGSGKSFKDTFKISTSFTVTGLVKLSSITTTTVGTSISNLNLILIGGAGIVVVVILMIIISRSKSTKKRR